MTKVVIKSEKIPLLVDFLITVFFDQMLSIEIDFWGNAVAH